MKKKIILSIAFMAMVTVSMIYHSYNHASQLSNLLLENVEALAEGESTGNVRCVGVGTVDCPIDHRSVKVVGSGYALE